MIKLIVYLTTIVVAALIGGAIGRSIGAQKAAVDYESQFADLVVASGCTIEGGRIKCQQ